MKIKADMWFLFVITPYLLSSCALAKTLASDTAGCFSEADYITCSANEIDHHPSVCKCSEQEKQCYIKFNITANLEPYVTNELIHPYNIFSINGGHIGPTIIVKSEQIVVVDVFNNIPQGFPNNGEEVNDDVSIHWHGMHQKNTPWMDGVGKVTQFPISSGKKFRYIFRAHPSGTFWYHSHMRKQRDEGIFGALIVLEEPQVVNKLSEFGLRSFEDMPENHTIAITEHLEKNERSKEERMPDGESVPVKGESILSFQINGIKLPQSTSQTEQFEPSFIVEPGESYRFRVIGAMEQTVLRFSIDFHKLFVIATDGYLTEPFPVDVIHLHVGERYDFILKAYTNVDRGTAFPIRIESVAYHGDDPNQPERVGIAYLKYGNNPDSEVKVHEDRCSQCEALNCPFEGYPKLPNAPFFDCHNVSELKLLNSTPEGELPDDPTPLTRFFNFDLIKYETNTSTRYKGLINNVQWGFPQNPFGLGLGSEAPSDCKYSTENTQNCTKKCPHTVPINDSNESMQFVFSALAKSNQSVLNIKTHPIHLHGHSFWVAKIAYPKYFKNGTIKSVNDDIKIDTECGPGEWRNGEPSDIEVNDITVRKDVIIVPAGGYVVIKFKAANPGWWFMHCHIDFHLNKGMALAINELQVCLNPPPPGLKEAKNNDFCFTVDEFKEKEKNDTCNVTSPNSQIFLVKPEKTGADAKNSQAISADEERLTVTHEVRKDEFGYRRLKGGDFNEEEQLHEVRKDEFGYRLADYKPKKSLYYEGERQHSRAIDMILRGYQNDGWRNHRVSQKEMNENVKR